MIFNLISSVDISHFKSLTRSFDVNVNNRFRIIRIRKNGSSIPIRFSKKIKLGKINTRNRPKKIAHIDDDRVCQTENNNLILKHH